MTPGAAAGRDLTLGEVTVQAEHEAVTSLVDWTAKRAATSTKTDTDLREAPQAVFVVTRDQMDGQGIQSLSEALRCTSGVGWCPDLCQPLVYARFPRARQTCLDGLRIRPAVISATLRKNLSHWSVSRC